MVKRSDLGLVWSSFQSGFRPHLKRDCLAQDPRAQLIVWLVMHGFPFRRQIAREVRQVTGTIPVVYCEFGDDPFGAPNSPIDTRAHPKRRYFLGEQNAIRPKLGLCFRIAAAFFVF